MNTIMGLLILQFPFFKYNRNILGFIFDITPLYNCPFCIYVGLHVLEVIKSIRCVTLLFTNVEEEAR